MKTIHEPCLFLERVALPIAQIVRVQSVPALSHDDIREKPWAITVSFAEANGAIESRLVGFCTERESIDGPRILTIVLRNALRDQQDIDADTAMNEVRPKIRSVESITGQS